MILLDRTTAVKYEVTIDDGEILYTSTASTSDPEPIVEDTSVSSTYWRIFIDDGQLGAESTVTVQDDEILFNDATLGTTWKLGIEDEQPYYFDFKRVSPSAQTLTINVLSPNVSGTANVSGDLVSVSLSVLAPTVLISQEQQALNSALSILTPSLVITYTPSEQSLSVSVLSPSLNITGGAVNVTIIPNVLTITASLLDQTIVGDVTIFVSTQTISSSLSSITKIVYIFPQKQNLLISELPVVFQSDSTSVPDTVNGLLELQEASIYHISRQRPFALKHERNRFARKVGING